MNTINSFGSWVVDNIEELNSLHSFDFSLATEIKKYLRENNCFHVADLGCGNGSYVDFFNSDSEDNNDNLFCRGFDGNPYTYDLLPNKECFSANLGFVTYLGEYDWVLSLEVGEHLPVIFETNFLKNLTLHADTGIILSWAIPGQGGHGHYNERENEYVIKRMESFGFYFLEEDSNKLRKVSTLPWFKNTIMVFKRS